METSHLSFPLEQFEIYPIGAALLGVLGLELLFPLTNQDVTILLVSELVLFLILLFTVIYGGVSRSYFYQGVAAVGNKFPVQLFRNYLQKVLEGLVVLIPSIFQIILAINILALIPGTYCFTAQFSVTAFLSGLVFFGAVAISAIWGEKDFPLHFIPANVPAALKLPLTVIELISYTSRLFSLAIRLFANLVAGHSLLHILGGSTVGIGRSLSEREIFLGLVGLVPLTITTAVYGLEAGIAGLQAYVFLVLSYIYLREAEHFIL